MNRRFRFLFLILVGLMLIGPNLAWADTSEGAAPPEDAKDAVSSEENWVDPAGRFWHPRRGSRTEVSLFIGGEAALGDIVPLEKYPSLGGMSNTLMMTYYPVDRLSVVLGARTYLGIGQPAAGTTAATVVTPFAGVRYDLVREGRFSLLTDVFTGPTFFLLADIGQVSFDTLPALGAEGGAGVAARYSLGPFTAEARGLMGLRAGAPGDIGSPIGSVGPFSAIYGGVEVGITWAFWTRGARGARDDWKNR